MRTLLIAFLMTLATQAGANVIICDNMGPIIKITDQLSTPDGGGEVAGEGRWRFLDHIYFYEHELFDPFYFNYFHSEINSGNIGHPKKGKEHRILFRSISKDEREELFMLEYLERLEKEALAKLGWTVGHLLALRREMETLWIVFQEIVPPSGWRVEYKVKRISLPIIDGPPLDIELDMSDGDLCHAYH